MRIITGIARGRRLAKLNTSSVRPTSDKVKGSLFNILGDDIRYSYFLDLFCGTGNIGLEAFSRGAGTVAFVDNSTISKNITLKNIELCGFSSFINKRLFYINRETSSALEILKKICKRADYIFLDPPYKEDSIYTDIFNDLENSSILHNESLIIAEHSKKNILSDRYGRFFRKRCRTLGDTSLSFYRIY